MVRHQMSLMADKINNTRNLILALFWKLFCFWNHLSFLSVLIARGLLPFFLDWPMGSQLKIWSAESDSIHLQNEPAVGSAEFSVETAEFSADLSENCSEPKSTEFLQISLQIFCRFFWTFSEVQHLDKIQKNLQIFCRFLPVFCRFFWRFLKAKKCRNFADFSAENLQTFLNFFWSATPR